MLHRLKKILPPSILELYHWSLAMISNWRYGRPSERMVVIGVTGTSGKSTVVEMIARVLETAGFTVGAASTIRFKIGPRETMNDTKMTMVGRFRLQKMLGEMVAAGCQYAVIETSSQGIEQFRHRGIHYDAVALTNLYPEHLDAHGGFENYKRAKLKLCKHLAQGPNKNIAGKKIPKTIIVNLDSPYAPEFLGFAVDQKIGVTTASTYDITGVQEVRAELLHAGARVGFAVEGQTVWMRLPGDHNAGNALLAYGVARAFGVDPQIIRRGLEAVTGIPGRIEAVDAGQPFTVIVDYAFEPRAMEKLYATVAQIPHRRIIQVLGTTGGGRDRARGAVLGEMAGRFADVVVVTNEDPYDDDPRELMERVAQGVLRVGKVLQKNLFIQPERQGGIAQAVGLAQPGDLVLVTGKGSEQAIVVAKGKKIPWDDRTAVREGLELLQKAKKDIPKK
ncbi:MAG: UDP-N-acetylmuramyl-tripeptide synthetase [Patescibacteria group bacterium]|nr:UDP-N-acetylmuramyl-tripeptide synthetase [Patescibacteria group bacterium]